MARLYALQLADQRAMERQGVRENPVRRNGYALQGGAAPTQPLRFELASDRAEEIQANRTNPRRKGATPTMGVSRVRGGKSKASYEHDREGKLLHETMEAHEAEGRAMKGGRAVPSSGLSQFRGGGSNGVIVGGGKHCDDSDEEMEGGGGRASEVLARESAPRPVIRAGLSDQHSVEAKEMGRHLGRHLMAVRGGGFFDLFTKGIVEAGQQSESIAKETGMPNANPLPPSSSAPPMPDAGADMPPPPPPASGGAVFHRRKDMLEDTQDAHEEHTARRFGMTRKGGMLSGSYEGMGECGGRTKRGKMMRKQKQIEEGNLLHTLDDEFPAREGREATHGDRTSGKKRTMVFNRERGAFGTNTEPSSSEEEESSGGTRSKAKPSKKEKNPYGRTHTSEMSLGKMKKVKKPAAAPAPPAAQPDVGLALDLPPPPPAGRGKGRRAPAGPNDGRRKRAEIVKKVMAEKGMKMIEASKYVKAHKLY